MLVKHRIAAPFRSVEGGACGEVKQQHDGAAGEGRQADQLQGLGCQGCPAVDGHAEETHARGAHAQDRGDEIDGPHDRGHTRKGNGHQPQSLAADQVAERILDAHRRIGPPAGIGRPAGHKEAGDQQAAEDRYQPERHGIEPWEGHVGGADHGGDQQIIEPVENREDEQEQHDCSVHRVEPVVHGAIDEIRGWCD